MPPREARYARLTARDMPRTARRETAREGQKARKIAKKRDTGRHYALLCLRRRRDMEQQEPFVICLRRRREERGARR